MLPLLLPARCWDDRIGRAERQPYDSGECVWIFGEEMSETTSSTKVSKLVKFGSQVSVSGSGLRRTMAGSGERGV